MNIVTPEYLAGFFDADGHIGIYKRGEKRRTRKDGSVAIYSAGHGINFTIVNVNEEVLYSIQKLIGGTISSRSKANPRHSTTHVLVLTNRQSILDCINLMLPHLIVKRDRCVLIKEYLISRIAKSPTKGSNTPVDSRELEIIHLVREEIHNGYIKQSKYSW